MKFFRLFQILISHERFHWDAKGLEVSEMLVPVLVDFAFGYDVLELLHLVRQFLDKNMILRWHNSLSLVRKVDVDFRELRGDKASLAKLHLRQLTFRPLLIVVIIANSGLRGGTSTAPEHW